MVPFPENKFYHNYLLLLTKLYQNSVTLKLFTNSLGTLGQPLGLAQLSGYYTDHIGLLTCMLNIWQIVMQLVFLNICLYSSAGESRELLVSFFNFLIFLTASFLKHESNANQWTRFSSFLSCHTCHFSVNQRKSHVHIS